MYPLNNQGTIPPIFFVEVEIPHTMCSEVTQPKRKSANYAENVAQISSVCSIFRLIRRLGYYR